MEALEQEADAATSQAVDFAEAGEWEPVADLLRDVYTRERPCA
jgi:TPP-dependent pyruvate/acetoin dehydrogenase alpha subunit